MVVMMLISLILMIGYINQPEKGPSFQTDEFMSGYNSGYDACSASSGDDESDGSASNDEGLRVIVPCSRSGFCMYLLR